jgi:hypothetical protein
MELETLKVYEEIRWAAIASDWPHPELYVSFKSGYATPGFGHTSRDLNAIQVVAGGEPLIRRSHNYSTPPEGYSTILVDGEPQGHGIGTFLYWEETERYRTVAGEADRSFGDGVSVVRRHVVMVDGRYVVLLDEVEADRPIEVTAMIHTPGVVEVKGHNLRILGRKTHLGIGFAGPTVSLRTVAPPACVMAKLSEVGVRAKTQPLREIKLVTVIWPEAGGVEIPECRWEGGILEVNRPDGECDRLRFGDREGVFGLISVS